MNAYVSVKPVGYSQWKDGEFQMPGSLQASAKTYPYSYSLVNVTCKHAFLGSLVITILFVFYYHKHC